MAPLLSKNEWQPHKIQGWTPDFVPEVLDQNVIDQYLPVNDDASIETSMELARKEGIFTGISGGATMLAALLIAKEAPKNSTFCVMLPDTGERYLSLSRWLMSLNQDLRIFQKIVTTSGWLNNSPILLS